MFKLIWKVIKSYLYPLAKRKLQKYLKSVALSAAMMFIIVFLIGVIAFLIFRR